MDPIGLFLVGAGLFAVCGAAFDWNWFFSSRKAQFMVNTFGRGGARIFYALIGTIVSTLGVLVTMGIIENNS